MKNLFFLDKAIGLWLRFFKKRTLILEIGTQMRDEIACLGLASKPPGTTGECTRGRMRPEPLIVEGEEEQGGRGSLPTSLPWAACPKFSIVKFSV